LKVRALVQGKPIDSKTFVQNLFKKVAMAMVASLKGVTDKKARRCASKSKSIAPALPLSRPKGAALFYLEALAVPDEAE